MRRTSSQNSSAFADFSLDVLGVKVDAVDLDRTVEQIERWVAEGSLRSISLATAHGVMDARRDVTARRAFGAADLVVPDGMSMVWLLRLAGAGKVGRVYGPDLMRAVCARSVDRGWSHYLLGGREETADRLARTLETEFPGIRIVGRHSPPFRAWGEADRRDMIDRIDRSDADVVWVGLGSPKQDVWMAETGCRLRRGVLIGVGAAFDLISGELVQAPLWIQRSGFEWLFRLAVEPRRLWRRYSRYPWFVLLVIARLSNWIAGRRRC